jgi:hypothetical protein
MIARSQQQWELSVLTGTALLLKEAAVSERTEAIDQVLKCVS